jgi:type III restriction enzyme
VGDNDLLTEEVSKIFGVPFEVIPFKAAPDGNPPPPVKRAHVHALPDKSDFEITFPRVVGYRQAIRNRISVNWDSVAVVSLDPQKIPPEVEVKAALPNNKGRPSLQGPGKLESLDLSKYRESRREQELSFELARDLTTGYMAQGGDHPPAHVLFPQVAAFVQRYLREKVVATPPAHILDIFLSPYYGWVIERLKEAIKPDAGAGEEPEIPVLEANRDPGSTSEVDFWTSKDVREVVKSHLNYVVADTKVWEQAAAYVIDTHPGVAAFVKNAGLGFSIPYLHNGQPREYVPDFIIRLAGSPGQYLVLETKGFDDLADIKAQAAQRWVQAVNADGRFGTWRYAMARKPGEVSTALA